MPSDINVSFDVGIPFSPNSGLPIAFLLAIIVTCPWIKKEPRSEQRSTLCCEAAQVRSLRKTVS